MTSVIIIIIIQSITPLAVCACVCGCVLYRQSNFEQSEVVKYTFRKLIHILF